MTIQLTNSGKRFNRDWIFRHLNFTFLSGHTYAVTGSNGSGKSTLLQIIAGSMDVSEGTISRESNGVKTDTEDTFCHISLAAPYIELIEEMTAIEFLTFHSRFKPLLNITLKEIVNLIGLATAANKQIRYYSSGMKQRVKIAQAIFSNVPLLLLDEPCTNLDTAGYELYHRLIKDFAGNKTIIVSSNDVKEYDFCEAVLDIAAYK